jgi:hypothetical protein
VRKLLIAAVALVAVSAVGFAGAQPVQAEEPATVTVKHGINGTSAGARLFGDPKALPRDLPVTVNVADGAIVLEDFRFRDSATATVPAGTYNVKVLVGELVVIDQDVTLAPGDDVTATAKILGKTPLILVTP